MDNANNKKDQDQISYDFTSKENLILDALEKSKLDLDGVYRALDNEVKDEERRKKMKAYMKEYFSAE